MPRSSPTADARHVLVVDDVEMNRALLARVLERAGYRCTLAATARRGLSALEAEKFDLVLLDLCLPDMDGMQFLDALAQRGALDRLPVVMLTGVDDPEVEREARRHGAVGFLPKPFDRRALLALLEDRLGPLG